MTVYAFNTHYRIGTPVFYTDDFGKEITTNTASVAWNLGDGTAVVKLAGKSEGYDLGRVKVIESHI